MTGPPTADGNDKIRLRRSDQNGPGHLGGSGFSVVGEPVVVHGGCAPMPAFMPKVRSPALTIADRCRSNVSPPPSTAASPTMFSSLMQLGTRRLHPSCEAVTKQYSYTWAHGGKHGVLRPLFDRHFVAFSAYALDPAPMHEAAQSLVGTHDFLAFTKIDHGRDHGPHHSPL